MDPKRIATESLTAFERGTYLAPEGGNVELSVLLSECLEGTHEYQPEHLAALLSRLPHPSSTGVATSFTVSPESTLQGAARLSASGEYQRIVVLNFASVRTPGGGFLDGARAQEESLARSSALYLSLLRCPEFYAYQVNRVAALAVSAAEMIAFGRDYMAQIVRNAQSLGAALARRGIPMLGAHKGFTTTHQVIADVRRFGGGLEVAQRLARANIITNKNLIPGDEPADWDRPGGLRLGTTEVTRLGMREPQLEAIAEFIARVLVEGVAPERVVDEVTAFREPYQTVYYCFEHGLPA